jgi:IstB-like ATP binding protein
VSRLFRPATRKRCVHRAGSSYVCEHAMSAETEGASGSRPLPPQNDVHYVADSCGIGKTWLACALAHRACRDGFFALHKRMAELFRELAVARADGSIGQLLVKLSRIDVLVLDDFAMAPLKDSERRDSSRSATTVTNAVRPFSPVRCRLRTGTNRSAIQVSLTASWTGSSTMPIASS